MIDNDAVVEVPYCIVCRRSSVGKWRKHIFSRGHQQTTERFLQQQVARLQALCNATTAVTDWWRCVFCDATLAIANAPAHFASDVHRKQVEAFCRQHRCDADRQTRPQLWLNATRLQQLEAALAKGTDSTNEQEKKTTDAKIVDQATSERVEAFLSSATSRLQAVRSEQQIPVGKTLNGEVATREQQQEALYGPQIALATGARHCKTVTSSEGVLQNPVGHHDGKRVWGGGIVKLRQTDWIPWAIDRFVKEEQSDQSDNGGSVHRVTELAQGEGLSSIAAVAWGSSVRNVHTAAVPPWMVQTEEEYKACNQRTQAVRPRPILTETTRAKDKRSKDVFSRIEDDSNWLPNFGGVWHEGPRSKTKQAFRKATTGSKASRSQAQPQTTVSSTFLPEAAEHVPTETIHPSAFLLPHASISISVVDSSTDRCETPSWMLSKPVKIKSTEEKLANVVDAKKQLLLAQKERMRAKMAASKQT